MSKLLRADTARMKRSREFWLCLAVFCIVTVVSVFTTWHEKKMLGESSEYTLDSTLFQFTAISGFFCAALAGLFVGSDYSNGTIRNKLIAGHRRSSIYFSNLAVTMAASVIMCAAAAAVTVAFGVPLLGNLSTDLPQVALMLLSSLLTGAACGALYTMITALLPGTASAVVVCFGVSLAMLFAASWLQSQLIEPEMAAELISLVDGKPVFSDPEPNPLYIGGIKRTVYELLADLLPAGQASQISNFECERLARFPALSILLIVVTSVIGWLGFRKRDIK